MVAPRTRVLHKLGGAFPYPLAKILPALKGRLMRREILASIAALLLLAACRTPPDQTAGAVNAGAGAGAQQQGAGVGQAAVPPAAAAQQPPPAAPRGPGAGTVQEFVTVGDRVLFDFDRFDLSPLARATLERQAAWLKLYPNVRIQVEGHCDERGTREYNLALGDRRAKAASNYLVSLGIAAARIKTISYGKERPAVLGSNEAAWSQNRRGVTVVN